MKVTFIGCPFQTSYGAYIRDLGAALTQEVDAQVRWVATKCGCGDPEERYRRFIVQDCEYFELPVISDYRSTSPLRRRLRFAVKHVFDDMRAARYESLAKDKPDVVHFQQTLAAFGSDVVFRWLKRRASARKVVTVHELDAQQQADPAANRGYNLAHAVLVHDGLLGRRLVETGVDAHRVHQICHGVRVDAQAPVPRDQRNDIVFYAGHKPMSGKGIDILFPAYASLQRELGDGAPRLLVHGHYGNAAPREGIELAARHGIGDAVVWLNQITLEDMHALYDRALLCVLPYSGSFAGLPCAVAAAHGVAVIGTDVAGIPEHLGEHYACVAVGDGEALQQHMRRLVLDQAQWSDLSVGVHAHAARALDWSVVARRTHGIYATVAGAAGDAGT